MGATTPVYALPYPLGTDKVQAGDNDIRALAERVEAVLSGPWQSYDPNWAVGPILVTLGKVARWRRQGTTVRVAISGQYYPGSGQGLYRFALPVPMATPHQYPVAVGSAWCLDLSTSYRYAGTVVLNPGENSASIWGGSTNGWGDVGGSSYPMVWAMQADQISLSFTYEAAATGLVRGDTLLPDDEATPLEAPGALE